MPAKKRTVAKRIMRRIKETKPAAPGLPARKGKGLRKLRTFRMK